MAPPLTGIRLFEVPPEADETFAAAWRDASERGSATLYRALRGDVALRYVAFGRVGAPGEQRAPPPFPAHAARYAVAREDGEPESAGGVLLVDPVAVPAGQDESFLAGWHRVHALLAARQGYLGSRLHRSVEPAEFGYVGVVRWSSPLMYARALRQPDVAAAMAAVPFPSQPALYLLERG